MEVSKEIDWSGLRSCKQSKGAILNLFCLHLARIIDSGRLDVVFCPQVPLAALYIRCNVKHSNKRIEGLRLEETQWCLTNPTEHTSHKFPACQLEGPFCTEHTTLRKCALPPLRRRARATCLAIIILLTCLFVLISE